MIKLDLYHDLFVIMKLFLKSQVPILLSVITGVIDQGKSLDQDTVSDFRDSI
jgi:hypothetical protein